MISSDTFAGDLVAAVGELAPVVADHEVDFGEILLHLLVGDVVRFTLAARERGDGVVVDQLLNFMDSR